MIKRPMGIKVNYLNEEGDEVEDELYEFNARMFLHELDHINGKIMLHWKLTEGNIEILDDKEKSKHLLGVNIWNDNLM